MCKRKSGGPKLDAPGMLVGVMMTLSPASTVNTPSGTTPSVRTLDPVITTPNGANVELVLAVMVNVAVPGSVDVVAAITLIQTI